MNDPVFKEISNTIDIISLHQARCKEFKKELEFFNDRWPVVSKETTTIKPELYLSALRRLGHEVMFLTIETFSLHEGIAKKKSLLSSSIRDNGALLAKVDKSKSVSTSNFTYLGDPDNHDDINAVIIRLNEKIVEDRKNLKTESGIKSKRHEDIDEWMNSIVNDEEIKKLKELRDNFAHSFDDIEKINNGNSFRNAQSIEKILFTIGCILNSYKKRLNELLTYTCSAHYDGIVGVYYDSFSRLEFYHKFKDKCCKNLTNASS